MTFLSLVLVLFLIMDPFGNAKSFIAYTDGIKPQRQRFIIMREMLMALAAMLFFNFLGDYIFNFMGITLVTQYLASGVILFLTAIKILFPKPHTDIPEPKLKTPEPFLVPLAIPMIAGPSLLATIMVYAGTEPSPFIMTSAILIAWVISSVILLSSKMILNVFGTSGLTACERLMGMVLVLIAVQRFLEGVLLFQNGSIPSAA